MKQTTALDYAGTRDFRKCYFIGFQQDLPVKYTMGIIFGEGWIPWVFCCCMDCINNGTILSHCVFYIVCYMSEAGFNNSLDCMLPSGGEILS